MGKNADANSDDRARQRRRGISTSEAPEASRELARANLPARGHTSVSIDRRQTVGRQVYDLLRERIETSELKPGSSLTERTLTEWLGVSRTPVKEAMRQLARDGLIVIVPHVGTSVALVDPRKIYEFCQIRLSLECIAAAEAATNITSAIAGQLEDLIKQQAATIETNELAKNIAIDSEFHRLIHRTSGFSTAADMLRRVMSEIIRARHLSIQLPGRLHGPIREHQTILAALKSKSPDRAATAMRAHLEKSVASVMRVMNANPEFLIP